MESSTVMLSDVQYVCYCMLDRKANEACEAMFTESLLILSSRLGSYPLVRSEMDPTSRLVWEVMLCTRSSAPMK